MMDIQYPLKTTLSTFFSYKAYFCCPSS